MTSAPRACLLGHPVAHSRSPVIHTHWLRTLERAGSYEAIDVTAADFTARLASLASEGFVGGNVTVPHKELAFRTVTRLDSAAAAIGAVNTLWFEKGELIGGNTDAVGFLASLDDSVPNWTATTAVLLGAGGAARAVLHALQQRGVTVRIVNRTLARATDLAARGPLATAHGFDALPDLLATADLLVNTTSLGMTGTAPLGIDLAPLKASALVCDIVYVPLETPLLRAARARGHRVVDGLGMLLHQAVPGFAHWFGATPRVTPELRAIVAATLAP
jgi:shikimate dehydrogenase